jgi:hypothetical protein
MSAGWTFTLLLLAAICFFIQFLLGVLSAPAEPSPAYNTFSRINWIALGLLLAVLPFVASAATHL